MLIGVLLVGRWVWAVSTSELGWSTHATWWSDTTRGLFGIERRTLAQEMPSKQAEFWLAETERIAGGTQDASLAMGAAWILDGPQHDYIGRFVRLKEGWDFPGLPPLQRRTLDENAIGEAETRFEAMCGQQCLAFANRAIELEPENVEWHRLRALLLFPSDGLGDAEFSPRDDSWLEILRASAEVDPDNALYDYLEADWFLSRCDEYEYNEETFEHIVVITDQDKFDRGQAALARGLAKRELHFGNSAYATAWSAVERSGLPLVERPNVAASAAFDYRVSVLLFGFIRWQWYWFDELERRGLFDESETLRLALDQIIPQLNGDESVTNLVRRVEAVDGGLAANWLRYAIDHPERVTDEQRKTYRERYAEAVLERKTVYEAGARMQKPVEPETTELALASGAVQSLTITCLILAVGALPFALFACWRRGKDDLETSARLGGVRLSAAWMLAVLGVAFLFGAVPAGVISAEVQTTAFGILVRVLYAVIIGFAVWLFARMTGRRPQRVLLYGLLGAAGWLVIWNLPAVATGMEEAFLVWPPLVSMLVVIGAVVVCLALLRMIVRSLSDEEHSPRNRILAVHGLVAVSGVLTFLGVLLENWLARRAVATWVPWSLWPEAEEMYLTQAEITESLSLDENVWSDALLQWITHHGPWLTLAAAVLVIGVWQVVRCRQSTCTWKSGLGEATRGVCFSATMASLVCCAVYTLMAPSVVAVADEYHADQRERVADPDYFTDRLRRRLAEVRSEPETMTRLRADAEDEVELLIEQAEGEREWREEAEKNAQEE